MQIRLTQNEIGQFNLCGNNKSLQVHIGIFKDNEIIKVGENYARLQFSYSTNLEYEKRDIRYEFDDFEVEKLLQRCEEHISHTWSTRDYQGDMNLFIDTFLENKDKIIKNFQEENIKFYEKKINQLKNINIKNEDLEFYKK